MNEPVYTVQQDNKIPEDPNEKPEASQFRTILPQILAICAKNLLLIELGLATSVAVIVIPALRGTVHFDGVVETLKFTDVQASWFGSIPWICQPIGSILSGWALEPLGRKKAMMLVNIPFIIAWSLLYASQSIEVLFLGGVMLGFSVGFMEAPTITYVGEICQPSMRGILVSLGGITLTLGFFIMLLLGSAFYWRTAALICLSAPILTTISISFIPETPVWLLSKKRDEEALKSLQWLRGWVSPKAVEKEFEELRRYSENSIKCNSCQKSNSICNHPKASAFERLKELKRRGTLRAFMVVIVIFLIYQFSGMMAMQPFLVQILKTYRVPVDPSWASVILSTGSVIASTLCLAVIKLVGKRRICISGIAGSLICCVALGTYGEIYFPTNLNSFDNNDDLELHQSYFPFIVFIILAFCTYGGITPTPWMLMSEVFSFKSRDLATSITAALNNVLGFLATKSYLYLDKGLSLSGTMWFFTVINILGLTFVYFLMPETENCDLEDIEYFFADSSRKFTDIKIGKYNRNQTEQQSQPKLIENGILGCENKGFSEN